MKVVVEGSGFANGWMMEDDKISILEISILGRKPVVKEVIPFSAITSFESNWLDPLGGGQIRFWYKKDGKQKYGILSYRKDKTLLAAAAAEYLKNNYGDGIGKIVWRERRMRCQVCGKLYCFTKDDLERNEKNAKSAVISSAVSGIAAIGGTRIDMYGQAAKAENALNKIVDYSRCPNCNSTDVIELSEEQYKAALSEQNQPQVVPQLSAADEIKKFKELLDSGIITQEEFDAKKKQLLGL